MATRPELHIAVAKKKSKASDYNENFSMMMDYVEAVALEDKNYVDGFMPTITGQSGKFLTNNGTAASWASLGNQPFGDYINGLIITKASNDTINISVGSCYDFAKAVILTNSSQATKQNESQTASTTYYVYIIDGTNIDFLITTASSSPTLPTGSTTYRQIGSYTTDSDSKIDNIYYYGLGQNTNKNVLDIIHSVMPDYTAGIQRASHTDITLDKDYLVVVTSANGGGAYDSMSYLYVDGQAFQVPSTYKVYGTTLALYVGKGSVIRFSPVDTPVRFTTYPLKGAD